ncbi:hypothetical protein HRF87_09250 [Bacillus sp. CRN 9]|nr:hypothetical protein [Bacillus sp. CRN 9]
MKKGRAPFWKDGTVIELHHLIQREPGSMVEIPASMHDEYNICLYTSKMENIECPVITWNRQGGLDDYNTAKNFYDVLSQRLLDAKEAWEEDF